MATTGPTVITNNHFRPIIDAFTLTPGEREEFDYIDWPAIDNGTDSASFFRYRGQLYDLANFIQSPPLFTHGWDAFQSDSFFSGIVIRYIQDDEPSVVVGRVYS